MNENNVAENGIDTVGTLMLIAMILFCIFLLLKSFVHDDQRWCDHECGGVIDGGELFNMTDGPGCICRDYDCCAKGASCTDTQYDALTDECIIGPAFARMRTPANTRGTYWPDTD